MKKKNCNLIVDLLPNYIENTVSEETKKDMIEHLKNCFVCKEKYEKMNVELNINKVNLDENIDFLKKVKNRKRLSIISGVFLTIIVLITGFIIGINKKVVALTPDEKINVEKMNVEYMYYENIENDKLMLHFYLDSEEYRDIFLAGETSYNSNSKEISYHISGKKSLYGNPDYEGIETSLPIDKAVEKIYIKGSDNSMKLIWEKSNSIMNKTEFTDWYNKEYVPKEIKDNFDLTKMPVSTWKMLYNKYYNGNE